MTGDPTCTLLDRWLVNTDRHTGEKKHRKKLLLMKSIILTPGRREEHNAVFFFFFLSDHRQTQTSSKFLPDLGQMCELVTST